MSRAPFHETIPTEVLSVRFTRDTLDRVRELARASDRPLSAQVRHIVRRAVEQRDPHQPTTECADIQSADR
jgi:predicted transcriptional regulator